MSMNDRDQGEWFSRFTSFKDNRFHPLVWIVGEPIIGEGVYTGGMSEVNARGRGFIGDYCDIASFVTINCADSHKKCIGLSREVERANIVIEDHIYRLSHSDQRWREDWSSFCCGGRNDRWACRDSTLFVDSW